MISYEGDIKKMATNERTKVNGKPSGNQTNAQIIAPGNNGQGYGYQTVIIDGGLLTLSAAGTIKLTSTGGAVILPAFNLAAATPLDLSKLAKVSELRSEPGEGVLLTTTGGGDCAYQIGYHYAP